MKKGTLFTAVNYTYFIPGSPIANWAGPQDEPVLCEFITAYTRNGTTFAMAKQASEGTVMDPIYQRAIHVDFSDIFQVIEAPEPPAIDWAKRYQDVSGPLADIVQAATAKEPITKEMISSLLLAVSGETIQEPEPEKKPSAKKPSAKKPAATKDSTGK